MQTPTSGSGDSRLTIEWEGTDEDLAELTVYFFKFVLGEEDEG